MKLPKIVLFTVLATGLFAPFARAAAPSSSVPLVDQVIWPDFLARHDLVWNRLPVEWHEAAFVGNGQLGAMVGADASGEALEFRIGRSDVNYRNWRIPVGNLELRPSGKITGGKLRQNLWNADVTGTVETTDSTYSLYTYTHADQMVQVIDVSFRSGAKPDWNWAPGLATNTRNLFLKRAIPPEHKNPAPTRAADGDIALSIQTFNTGGAHVTAWQIVPVAADRQLVYLSVGFSPSSEDAALAEAVAAVRRAVATGAEALAASHRKWWHEFWPASFVSIPDTRLEGFYWIQLYKMASATRPGRPALDLMGPWFRETPWTMIWWNLNIQLTYWPQLGSNRLALGQSFLDLIDRNHAAFAANAREFAADSAAVGRASGYDGVSPVGDELCNLPWALHNYWLQYRYSMDEDLLRRLFPLLNRSAQFYLHLLKDGPDGKLHLTEGLSPEYPKQPKPNPDCNIDLSLLRWACQTLIDTSARLKLDDPQVGQWRDTLARLVDYPTDQNGLMISATVPFATSHRHYSHLLMIYPLYLMTPEQPQNRELVVRSLKHWMSMPSALEGYSYTGAASISALLGEGDEAARYLNKLLDSKTPPNTLYKEWGPVIETPLSAAASLHDMLLSSWGDRIRVFPAVPEAWRDVVFRDLRTEGAFLVSAARKDGTTRWVTVKSLAGQPCRIRPGLVGKISSTVPFRDLGDGTLELRLALGETAVLHAGAGPPDLVVAPVPATPAGLNAYGLK